VLGASQVTCGCRGLERWREATQVIADVLKARGVHTARRGQWYATSFKNVLERGEQLPVGPNNQMYAAKPGTPGSALCLLSIHLPQSQSTQCGETQKAQRMTRS